MFNFIEIFLKKSPEFRASLIVVIFPGKIIRKISVCSLTRFLVLSQMLKLKASVRKNGPLL